MTSFAPFAMAQRFPRSTSVLAFLAVSALARAVGLGS